MGLKVNKRILALKMDTSIGKQLGGISRGKQKPEYRMPKLGGK
jgi:hypothetical protein